MPSVSSAVAGAVLGAVAAVLLPQLRGIWQPETPEMDLSDSPSLACQTTEWRFHVKSCENSAQLRQTPSDPTLQLLFNASLSRARILRSAQQGVIAKEDIVDAGVIAALDVYEGAALHVGGHCYTVTGPADDETRVAVDCYRQSTFAMIKPDAFARAGEVLSRIEKIDSLRIAGLRLVQLEPPLAQLFYAEHSQRSFFEDLVSYVTSGPVVALHLVGPDAVRVWREALGPTDSNKARLDAPASVRALFGVDKQRNAAHGSDSVTAARREVSFFFHEAPPGLLSSTEPLTATSCLVLPHVLRDGSLGALVSSLRSHHASATVAAQLVRLNHLDAWRYVTGQLLPRAQPSPLQLEQIQELLSGPAVSLELHAADAEENSSDYVHRFKDVIGPRNPAKARQSSVESIRANFGISEAQSGLLCPWYDWPS